MNDLVSNKKLIFNKNVDINNQQILHTILYIFENQLDDVEV